jgi:membrane protease YdiL (CAAX protease family)
LDGNNNQFEQPKYDPFTGQPIEQSPEDGTSSQYGNYQYTNPQYAYPGYGYGIPQAPAFDERRAGHHFSRIGLSYFVFWIASLLLGNGVAIVLYLVAPDAMDNYLISMLVALLPMYLIGAPLCWLCLRGVRTEKPEKNHWSFWQILGGFIVAYSMMHIGSWIGTYVGEIIESYIPDAQASTNSVQELVLTGEMWVNVMAMVIFGPIAEELLFRKFLCDRLKPFGDGVAIVVSGIMFGLFHGNITQGIYACMLGMIFAYVYLKTGNIFITIGYHVVANFMGSVLPLLLLNSAALGGLDEVMAGGDPNALSEFIMGNMDVFFLYGGYVLLIFGLMIAGVVILIVTVARGRVRINPGTYRIPSGKRFKTVFINVGMILFLLGCFSEVLLNTFF